MGRQDSDPRNGQTDEDQKILGREGVTVPRIKTATRYQAARISDEQEAPALYRREGLQLILRTLSMERPIFQVVSRVSKPDFNNTVAQSYTFGL